jgi:hypothetical protein
MCQRYEFLTILFVVHTMPKLFHGMVFIFKWAKIILFYLGISTGNLWVLLSISIIPTPQQIYPVPLYPRITLSVECPSIPPVGYFRHHIHTCITHDLNTMGLPTPMMIPKQGSLGKMDNIYITLLAKVSLPHN